MLDVGERMHLIYHFISTNTFNYGFIVYAIQYIFITRDWTGMIKEIYEMDCYYSP